MRMIGRTTAAATSRRGGAVALGLALAAGVAWSVPATAAHAAAPAVEYSLDGLHWSAQPPTSVFDGSWVPVPGSSRTASVYLRSVRSGDTIVGVYAGKAAASDAGLLVATTVQGADGEPLPLSTLGDCRALASQSVLGEGDTLQVPLTVAVDPELTTGQEAGLELSLLIDLSDTGVPTLAGGCPVDPAIIAAFPGAAAPSAASARPLADTGTDTPVGWLAAAGALLIGGAGALIAARRRAPDPKVARR